MACPLRFTSLNSMYKEAKQMLLRGLDGKMDNGKRLRILVFLTVFATMAALLMNLPFTHEAQSQEAASAPTVKGDPNGSQTGTINDVPAKVSGKPTLEELG